MEKQSKHLEKFTDKLLEEAGLHQPSADFKLKVMQQIEQTSITAAYKPLISKRGWIILATVIVIIGGLMFIAPTTNSEAGYLSNMNIDLLGSFELPFEKVEITKKLLYAVMCISLFLVQIPFLKKLTNPS